MDDLLNEFTPSQALGPPAQDLLSFTSNAKASTGDQRSVAVHSSASTSTGASQHNFFSGLSNGINIEGDALAATNVEDKPIDNDDFGDFITSPPIQQDEFQPEHTIPNSKSILQFLRNKILIIPRSFISELASVSFPQRQAVLNHPTTKKWLKALVEGSVVAQRIIHGCYGSQSQAGLADLCKEVIYQWEKLMPRITSLSMNTISPQGLTLVSNPVRNTNLKNCEICGTKLNTMEGDVNGQSHRSCVTVVQSMRVELQADT